MLPHLVLCCPVPNGPQAGTGPHLGVGDPCPIGLALVYPAQETEPSDFLVSQPERPRPWTPEQARRGGRGDLGPDRQPRPPGSWVLPMLASRVLEFVMLHLSEARAIVLQLLLPVAVQGQEGTQEALRHYCMGPKGARGWPSTGSMAAARKTQNVGGGARLLPRLQAWRPWGWRVSTSGTAGRLHRHRRPHLWAAVGDTQLPGGGQRPAKTSVGLSGPQAWAGAGPWSRGVLRAGVGVPREQPLLGAGLPKKIPAPPRDRSDGASWGKKAPAPG